MGYLENYKEWCDSPYFDAATKQELAEIAGISVATLTKMKQGKGAISTLVWEKICIALNCKIDDFLELIPIQK